MNSLIYILVRVLELYYMYNKYNRYLCEFTLNLGKSFKIVRKEMFLAQL